MIRRDKHINRKKLNPYITRIKKVFFFKQKTAYEVGTGDWSSDVCSTDLCRNEKWAV